MALVAVVVPVSSGYAVDMQGFLDNHPLLGLEDIRVNKVSDSNGIYLVYDDTKEQV